MRLRYPSLRDRLRFQGWLRGGGCAFVGGLLGPGVAELLVRIVE